MSVTRRSVFAFLPSLFVVPVVVTAKSSPTAAEFDEDRRATERMCATLAQLRQEYAALDRLPTLVVRYPRLWRRETFERRLEVAMKSSGWRRYMLIPADDVVTRIEYAIIGPDGEPVRFEPFRYETYTHAACDNPQCDVCRSRYTMTEVEAQGYPQGTARFSQSEGGPVSVEFDFNGKA